MQELEKILEEIELEKKRLVFYPDCSSAFSAVQIRTIEKIEQIICKYMSNCKRMNDGWISVEERLPIPDKEVWVTVKRKGKVFTSTDSMTEKGHFWNYDKENILAWKEKETIPEPYRPERNMK